ncbi:hypothetical protein DZG01_24695 [Pseudomonas fluorescens]|nr:hypothetical protein DZG01_24695 [Pseudomonas fluorescens]
MCRRHREQARSHRVLCRARSRRTQRIQGGSEPARDSGGSVGIDVGCAAAIASRLAPAKGCWRLQSSGFRVGYANLPATPAVRSGCESPHLAHGRPPRPCPSG